MIKEQTPITELDIIRGWMSENRITPPRIVDDIAAKGMKRYAIHSVYNIMAMRDQAHEPFLLRLYLTYPALRERVEAAGFQLPAELRA